MTRRSLVMGASGALISANGHGQTQSSSTGPGRRFDLERFIDDVRLADADGDTQGAVEELLHSAIARPGDVLAALPGPLEAGIHPVFRSERITILNVVWAPLMVLLPHNHNMWATIGVYAGREDNVIWGRRGNRLAAIGAAALSEKDVFSLPSDAIHSVVNPIGRLTGALHIYGGDFFAPGRSEWDSETLSERPWDLEGARDEFRKAAARFEAVP